MRLTVSLAIVLALAMGGVVAYEYQRVPIKSHVVVTCSDPKHKGNTVIRDEIVPLTVPRKDRSGLLEHSWSSVCDTCKARNEAEAKAEQAKREREERAAREREEAEKIFENLEVKLGDQEISLLPGHEIRPGIIVKNRGQEPISDLRFALKDDDKCLDFAAPDWHAFGLDQQDVLAKEESNRRQIKVLRKAYDDLLSRGVPICVGDTPVYSRDRIITRLRPYGVHDPYRAYTEDVGRFGGGVLLEKPFVPASGVGDWPPEWIISLYPYLILRADLAGGQDKHFSQYLIYQGVRHYVGTVTIHVMYSEPPEPVVEKTATSYDCARNLNDARGSAAYDNIMEGHYASLAKLKKIVSMKCPVTGQAYVYNRSTGKVSCPSHKDN